MKKLIPAICMTLIAAFMLASSTFAWFSMNTTVTATGMEVKAETNNPFLQIIAKGGSFDSSVAQNSAAATNGTKTVRPTSAVKTVATDSIEKLTNSDTTFVAGDIKWVEAFSDNPANSANSTGNKYNDVTAAATDTVGDTNVYTLINDFQVRLNPTAAQSAPDLKVSRVTITATSAEKAQLLPAVRVLIVCGDNWAIWKNGAQVAAKEGASILLGEITTDAKDIRVYVYFDGEDTTTTLNNAAAVGKLDGYNVVFDLSIGTAA